jgi:hypothetical protein
MDREHDVELANLEDDLSLLEEHAKHVISLLGRGFTDLGERVKTLQEAGGLYAEIRQIRDKVHALRAKP